jgi:S-adenosylmethionine:tRNA ribosyltransferase-isomerase
MRVDQFDFDLPEERIALRPAEPRDRARMLVVDAAGQITHAQVRDLPGFLAPHDALVLNDTRVIRARLRGLRAARPGGTAAPRIEVTLHKRLGLDRFLAFARPARKLEPGDRLALGECIAATVERRGDAGEVELRFAPGGAALDEALATQGEIPLPPYIAGKRAPDARDATDYQTIYAREGNSVAAPTAGLHFTPELLAALATRGVARETVTLHVGAGTFLPVSTETTEQHRMHSEWAHLGADAAERLNGLRASGGRIAAVGTTSLRTLESAADADGRLQAFDGDTDIFITPGYRFRAVDILLTNFHLPRSTLFMLVSAFSGLDTMKAVYAEAIRENYRFYSYGDACLLFRRP